MESDGDGISGGAATDAEEQKPRLGEFDGLLKLLHGLGLATVLAVEYWRSRLESVAKGATPPDDVQELIRVAASSADKGLTKASSDLFEVMSFGQERAALWAAAFFALVVRINRHGPREAQLAISYVCGAYCAVGTSAGFVYLWTTPGLWCLAIAFVIIFAATRK